jgi:hypothetical protein
MGIPPEEVLRCPPAGRDGEWAMGRIYEERALGEAIFKS